MQTKQSVAVQILKARAILDEIYGDAVSPLHDHKHPRHRQVSQAVADLEAELFRLTCSKDSQSEPKDDIQANSRLPVGDTSAVLPKTKRQHQRALRI